jgi:hypothetical protein
MATYRTIIVKGDGLHGEAVANSPITPGMLLNARSDGKVEANASATLVSAPMVAKENENFGKGIDDAYASGDNVEYVILDAGSEFQGLVAAAAAAIGLNDRLQPAAGGFLAKATAGTEVNAIYRALEAVDNHLGASPARLLVQVLS